MRFKKGDIVLFLNERMEGTVQSTNSKGVVTVLTTEGFEIPVLEKDIVHKLTDAQKREDKQKPQKTEPSVIVREDDFSDMNFMKEENQRNVSKPHSHRRDDVEMEIDIHIERLLKKHQHLGNAQIVRIQMEYTEQAMKRAFTLGMHRLIIIHGVGNGTLKEEVRKLLKRYSNIRYADASFQKYGNGATVVYLK
ncbi:MAG: Smr/MutS family protein [Bacteroidetes bacterium]|nr:Smr/MutS family protein [Bacteroidota bacterium]